MEGPAMMPWLHDTAVSGSAVAVVCDDQSITRAALVERVTHLADRLRLAGYGPGTVIASVTENSIDHVVLLLACAAVGCALAPLSWRSSVDELAARLDRLAPGLVVVSTPFAARVGEALGTLASAPVPVPVPVPALALAGVAGVEGDAELNAPAPAPATTPRTPRDTDPLLIVVTAGTTGSPRAAVMSRGACEASSRIHGEAIGLTADDVVLGLLPQYHLAGWTVQPLEALRTGALLVLMTRFDPDEWLRLIERHRVTVTMGVPRTYAVVAERRDFERADLSSLRLAVVGGAACPVDLVRRWHDRGVPLAQGYGLTEAGPNVLLLDADDALTHAGSVGREYRGVEVALIDTATGEEITGPGTGEVWVRCPGLFTEYLGDREATDAVLVDGWLHTGDVARRGDDGRYTIVDRLDDLFTSGGETTAPAEIEAVLRTHPALTDAAVVGMPDDAWGERAVAWVVTDEVDLDLSSLHDWSRTQLAPHQRPREFHRVDEIPHTALGKPIRRLLRTGATSPPPDPTPPTDLITEAP